MDNEIPEINELIKQFAKLPGLGPKSAKRIILKLINNKDNMVKPLAKSLAEVYKKVVRCTECGNLKIIDTDSVFPKLGKKTNLKVIFEPGRFIIGDAGILLSKIIYIKQTKQKNFIILDAAMNDLIRPALYDAKHRISPSEKKNSFIRKKII